MQLVKKVNPDKRGRITLGKMAEGVEGYNVKKESDGTIILTPFVTVHPKEAWLYNNPVALEKVKTGLNQLSENELIDLGDFSQFANDD